MKIVTLTLYLVLISTVLLSQSIASRSIGAAGRTPDTSNTPSLHWNVGEVVIGYVQNDNALNQGLYQYLDLSTAVEDPAFKYDLANAWPNPTHGPLNISNESSTRIEIHLLDQEGRLLKKFADLHANQSTLYEVSSLVPTQYYLLVSDRKGKNQIIKFQKI